MTDKELFKLALEALEELRLYPETPEYFKRSKAITALKERLLEASMREVQRLGQEIEQEPVAWMSASRFGELQKGVSVITTLTKQRAFEDDVAIHTHPPQRTEQEHDPLPRACNLAGVDYQTFLKIKAYMPVYDTVPPQRTEPIQSLQCAHCQVTIETLNDKVMSLLAERTKQKPAAWIHIDPNKPKVKFLEWKENEHGYRGTWIKKPLYLHPAQRTWVVFPTMLRKMWSGGEVQAWLDENVNKENT